MEKILILIAIIFCSCNTNNKLPEPQIAAVQKDTFIRAAVTKAITPDSFKQDWNSLVQLKMVKCEKVMYGGVRKLVFSLFNDSPYMIDSICVRVDYFDNKKLYKFGFATAIDIEQGNEIVIDAPASLRGDSVSYYVDHLTVIDAKMDKKFSRPKNIPEKKS